MKKFLAGCVAYITVIAFILTSSSCDRKNDKIDQLKTRAEQGDTVAQASIGLNYKHGWDVPQDYQEAVKWFAKAAEQGDVHAQTKLGHMYYIGQGVPADYVEAYKWLILAIGQGNKSDVGLRDTLEAKMSPEQIEKAQRLAKAFVERKGTQ